MIALAAVAVNAYSGDKGKYIPTEKECIAMLNEADDFIDDMAEGQQDRQADAIYHSLHGTGGELAAFRNSENAEVAVSDGVVRKEIAGEGETRGITMRLHSPESPKGKLPLLVFFHGGGWTTGGLNSCARFCDALAASGKAVVLVADYSLSPERPYPIPVEDSAAVVRFAIEHADELGSTPESVSIGGESTGGNLALSAIMKGDLGKKVKSIVAFYPVLKAGNDRSASWKKYSRGYGLDGRLLEAYSNAYLSNGGTADDPYVSPSLADDSALKTLPPLFIVAAERDILLDQGKEFADRVSGLGVKVERVELPGAVHGFISKEGQPTAFRKGVELTESFLK